jgi:hypothetical protein
LKSYIRFYLKTEINIKSSHGEWIIPPENIPAFSGSQVQAIHGLSSQAGLFAELFNKCFLKNG